MASHTRRAKGDQGLATQVREVLLSLGGQAHRSMVIEQVARALGHDARNAPEELQAAVIGVFEANCRQAALGFHLPFGEGSHRWGVLDRTAH